MRAEVITDLDETASIEDDWRRLAEARGNAFITPEWFRAWFGEYGQGQTPAIAVAREDDGSTAGVVPLVSGGRRGRTLRFAGANLGDLFEPACDPAREDEVAAAVADALAAASRSDAVILDYAPAGRAWPAALSGCVGPRRSAVPQRLASLPYVAIAGLSWDDYLLTRSSKFRKRLRYLDRAIRREHDVAFEQVDDPARLDDAFSSLFHLHDLRWSEHGGSSISSERARSAHRAFAGFALARGWLRLRRLLVDGAPVAAFYGWRLGPRYAFYQGGFDPSWGKHSVGLQLVASSLRGAIEEGASEFDMLLGTESYKARFTSEAREVESVAFVRRGSSAAAAIRAEAALRRLGSGIASGDGALGRLARGAAGRLPGGRRV